MKFDNDKSIKIGSNVKIIPPKNGQQYIILENGAAFSFLYSDSKFFNEKGVIIGFKKTDVLKVKLENKLEIYWPLKLLKKL